MLVRHGGLRTIEVGAGGVGYHFGNLVEIAGP